MRNMLLSAPKNNRLTGYNIGIDPELKKMAISGELNFTTHNDWEDFFNHPNVFMLWNCS